MPNQPSAKQLAAENKDLRARLEKAEASLREVLSGEADAIFIPGADGAQLFTLKGADQSYRTLIENMSEGALILTPQGLVLYANQRFAEMLGAPLEKVIGSEVHHWFAPKSRQVIQALLQNKAIDSYHEELNLAAADGTQVPTYLSVSRLVLGKIDSVCMVATDLTEQKRTEAILTAEKLSNAILEQAADAIVICDESGRIMRASKQAQALCGKRPHGQLFDHVFPLRYLDGAAFSSIDMEHSQSVESILNINGREYNLLVSVGHLVSARDELLGSVVTLTDITERKQSEEKILESKNLLQLLIENVPSRIFWKDSDSRYLGCNTRFALDAGLSSPDELIGKTDFDMPWKDDQAELYRNDDKDVMESGTAKLDIKEPQTTADGNTIWLQTSKVPLRDKDKQIFGVLGLYSDITERIRIEQELHESERRFSDMLGNVELISMMLDREARITYCNDYLLRLTGWQYEEVIGKNWWELFVPPEIQDLRGAFFTSLLDNQPEALHHENEILTRSGERRLIRWNNSVLRSGAGDVIGTASIGEDITERKKSEASIKYLNRVLSVLSGINTLIVRVNDREELLREACNIAVEAGGFRMALIVIVDPVTMLPVSVVSTGMDEELLAGIKNIMSTRGGLQKCLGGQTIREKQAVIANNLRNDPSIIFGEEYAKQGINSLVTLPLLIAGEAVGILTLYASEIEFFQEDEMKLLTELAGDIAFAIGHIDKQERLNYLAYYDVLTGLANRTLFLERVTQYMRSANTGGHKLALGLIDLERFKNINDSLGRPAGDSLLKQVAEWLTLFVQDANLLARFDADHFAFVLPEIKTEGNLAMLVENLMTTFQEHSFNLNDATFRIGIKVGIAVFPDDGSNADTLYAHAEAALKKTKLSGVRYLFYTQEMTEAVADKLALENQLRRAIDNEEFVLYYQPKVNIMSGEVTSAEALIRWNDPLTGLVPPGKFIPILEETGLIFEVGRWALRQTVTDCLRWRKAGLRAVRLAVNVSPLQLHNLNFIDELREILAVDAEAAAGLELEITESLIMQDIENSIPRLDKIRALGITIAIDDFGTGFSSLSYLAKLPVDTLKIDRAFVIEMDNPEGLALVSTIITLAHALKLKVVAEGVETDQQLRQLLSMNCDEMQGFLFSKPVPAEVFEAKFLVAFPQSGIHLLESWKPDEY